MTDPRQVMVTTTDLYGEVEAEPLYVSVDGQRVTLACGEFRAEGFVDELRAALVPDAEEKAA